MRVLFIGGTGEISTACVRRAAEAGHAVRLFHRGRTEEPLPEGVHHIIGNIADDDAYAALGRENFDVVCQFIAYDAAAVRRDVQVFGGRCGQYIFISTASAYRKPLREYVITEAVPLANPYWPYSQAKADAEAHLLAEHAAGRIRATIVRPSHTHRAKFPGGIASGDDWAWRILQDKPIIVHGDGTSLWTLTYATDFAVPFVNLFGKPAALGQAFHITRHMESYTWNRIYLAVGEALDAEASLVHVPTDTIVRYNREWAGPLLGDKAWPVIYDNTKVMSVAGEFECRVSLEEGLRLAAEHVRRRLTSYTPNAAQHALLDRIAAGQESLGD